MKDKTEIINHTLDVILPYLAVGGQEVVNEAAKDVWLKIKSIFKKGEHKVITSQIEESPNDPVLINQLRELFQSQITENQELRTLLFDEFNRSHKAITQVTQKGNENIAVGGNINNSTIHINK